MAVMTNWVSRTRERLTNNMKFQVQLGDICVFQRTWDYHACRCPHYMLPKYSNTRIIGLQMGLHQFPYLFLLNLQIVICKNHKWKTKYIIDGEKCSQLFHTIQCLWPEGIFFLFFWSNWYSIKQMARDKSKPEKRRKLTTTRKNNRSKHKALERN